MFRYRPVILAVLFATFFASSYLWILENSSLMYWSSVLIGVLTIPVTALLYRSEISSDFSSSFPYVIVLVSALAVLSFFVSMTDFKWGSTIPIIFVTPVLTEEFNFRYLLQRILLRKYSPYPVVVFQAILYTVYYAKYAVVGGGAAYPFPYNVVLISSMFGMGLVYGILTKLSKNFFLPATLHLVIWAVEPWLPYALASTIVPA